MTICLQLAPGNSDDARVEETYERLHELDQASALEPAKLIELAHSAYLIGHDGEGLATLMRAHQGFAQRRDLRQAGGTAAQIASILMSKGDVAQAAGWMARAARLLDESGEPGHRSGPARARYRDLLARLFLIRLVFRVVFHRLLTVETPIGRRVRRRMITQGAPLIRVKPHHLAAAGVLRVPKLCGAVNGLPALEDHRLLDVMNVIWCTGFGNGLSWIDLPIFDSVGEPRHQSGISSDEPGLYFVGLHFLHSFSSTMIHGIARDAKRIADAIERRTEAIEANSPAVTANRRLSTAGI